MTRSVIFYISILLLCFTFNNVFAQEINNISKNKNASSKSKIYLRAATGDKVIIKDAAGNTLIQINDEGTFGSITIPDSIGAPSATTNKLYNINGTLNFNGTALGATGATDINGLSDGKTAGNSVYLGNGAGTNDAGTTNTNTAAGSSALYSNTTGRSNVANGYTALYSNISGSHNVANGTLALYSNTSGSYSTATGNAALYLNTIGSHNVANGIEVLYSNTSGSYNTATGASALYFNTTGNYNVANGDSALYSNTDGNNNTAIGGLSLFANIIGNGNTAVGKAALSNTEGNRNTAVGRSALHFNYGNRGVAVGYQSQQFINNIISSPPRTNYNTSVGYQSLRGSNSLPNSGSYNSAFGYQALYSNTTGHHNTAIGDSALYSNILGNNNIAIGSFSLFTNTSGKGNTTTGNLALYSNTTGSSNTAIGNSTLYQNDSGNRNTALGSFAMNYSIGNRGVAVGYQSQQYIFNIDYSPPPINYNTSVGYQSLRGSDILPNKANNNSAFGYQTLFSNISGIGNVAIGFQAGYNETGSNKLYIANSSTSTPLIWGNFSTRKIVINGNGASNSNGRTFFSNGQAGGTTAWFNDSDRRLKKNISTISNALEKIKKLRGVNYQWKNTEHRSEGTKMGFIAQEAIKVIPEVVDDSGDHYSMQYAPITALLVEAVKEQQKNIKEQELRIKKLEEENNNLKAVVNENKSLRSEINIIKAALNKIVKERPEVKVSIK
ncbi:MAG: hypothetical protein GXO85_12155 [Chlorobi bacterium]|nr:hypothetical protein [Chlorobiota bacterium]